jgi:hypothetical protein
MTSIIVGICMAVAAAVLIWGCLLSGKDGR